MPAKLKEGDIYIVKFHPVYGSELKRYRPAVVVTSKVNSIDERFALIAPFSTKTDDYNIKYELLINNSALDGKSVLLPWYLKTIDISRLEHKIGRLNEKDVDRMKKKLKSLF